MSTPSRPAADEGEGEKEKEKEWKKGSIFDCLVNLDMYYFYVHSTPPLPAARRLPPAQALSTQKESAGQRLH